jgi:hypothetical protein
LKSGSLEPRACESFVFGVAKQPDRPAKSANSRSVTNAR